MTRPWLRPLARALFPNAQRRHGTRRAPSPTTYAHPRRHRPILEILEDRTLPALITWINPAGGSWGTAANWDLNRTPTSADDVVIPDLPGSQTITYSTGTSTVASIQTAETLSVTGGTLTMPAT